MQVIHFLTSFAWNTNNFPIHHALTGLLKTIVSKNKLKLLVLRQKTKLALDFCTSTPDLSTFCYNKPVFCN